MGESIHVLNIHRAIFRFLVRFTSLNQGFDLRRCCVDILLSQSGTYTPEQQPPKMTELVGALWALFISA